MKLFIKSKKLVYKTMEKHHTFFHSFSKGHHQQRYRKIIVEVNNISLVFYVTYLTLNKSKRPFNRTVFSPLISRLINISTAVFSVFFVFLMYIHKL